MNIFLIAVIASACQFLAIIGLTLLFHDTNPFRFIAEEVEDAVIRSDAFDFCCLAVFGPVLWAMFAYYVYQEHSPRVEKRREQERLEHPERYAPYEHKVSWI